MKQVLATLGSADFWLRLLYILLFALAWQVAELLLVILVVLQIVSRVLTGQADTRVASHGNSLSQYAWQIARYLTGASEQKPWPFMEWPAGDAQWKREIIAEPSGSDNKVDVAADSARP
jgi:hypothetical protein